MSAAAISFASPSPAPASAPIKVRHACRFPGCNEIASKICTGCFAALYCSRAHQTDDRAAHQPLCLKPRSEHHESEEAFSKCQALMEKVDGVGRFLKQSAPIRLPSFLNVDLTIEDLAKIEAGRNFTTDALASPLPADGPIEHIIPTFNEKSSFTRELLDKLPALLAEVQRQKGRVVVACNTGDHRFTYIFVFHTPKSEAAAATAAVARPLPRLKSVLPGNSKK